jgi:hypothetical protein
MSRIGSFLQVLETGIWEGRMLRNVGKYFLMAAVTAAPAMLAPVRAHAQPGWGYQEGTQQHEEKEFRHGFDQGRSDREHGMPYNPGSGDDEYRAGYRSGYQGGDRDNPGYRDYDNTSGYSGYGGYPGYGNGWDRGASNAAQMGFQDGLRHGESDRRSGHSFRPQHDEDYEHADHGYNSSMGSKQAYKDQYRQGYVRGYEQAYNGGSRR